MEIQARDVPTNDQVLPPKLKRSRDESIPSMLFTPPQAKQPMPPNIFVNDDGNDVFVDNIGNTTAIHLTPAFGAAADAELPRQSASVSSTPLPNHSQQDVRPKTGRLRHCSMTNRSPGTNEYVAKEKVKRMQQQQEADEACKRILQQKIDEKKAEAQKKREERQAALKAKIDRQNKAREERNASTA